MIKNKGIQFGHPLIFIEVGGWFPKLGQDHPASSCSVYRDFSDGYRTFAKRNTWILRYAIHAQCCLSKLCASSFPDRGYRLLASCIPYTNRCIYATCSD